jgi:UDP-N-acetylglucosamine diphosphorylase/glucosamine-1-phosphate N-acetyltransferase
LIHSNVDKGSHLLGLESIQIGRHTRIKPCVVIDAENGPVWIADNVTVQPHSYIQGPAYIGPGCLLQPGTVIREGTTIGPNCKVGGDIEGSILHGNSHKQHDGYLGHSYVGSWVSIAADCINSDLKNTYGTVRVPINGREVETGEMLVGTLVGDYSKTAVNVSFPTGAVVGFCSNVLTPRSPKFVPSFAWLDGDTLQPYDAIQALAIARTVMLRRNCQMTAAQECLFFQVRQQALMIEHVGQAWREPKRLAAKPAGHNGNGRKKSILCRTS